MSDDHVSAMTTEELHSKHAIACELAERDRLERQLTERDRTIGELRNARNGWIQVEVDMRHEFQRILDITEHVMGGTLNECRFAAARGARRYDDALETALSEPGEGGK